jgi:hypothetical protein
MRVSDNEAAQRVADNDNLVGELVEALRETMGTLSEAIEILYCGAGRTEQFGARVGKTREKFHEVLAKAQGAQQ